MNGNMEQLSDKAIIELLSSKKNRDVDKALVYLNKKLFPIVRQFILKKKGTINDAEDVMQDGLVAFYKMLRAEKLKADVNVGGYIVSICKNLWYRLLQQRGKQTDWSDELQNIPVEDFQLKTKMEDEQSWMLKQLKLKMGDRCFQLLICFYYDRLRMKEIVETMGFSNEQVAKNTKSKCMKKLKALVEGEPQYLKAFKLS